MNCPSVNRMLSSAIHKWIISAKENYGTSFIFICHKSGFGRVRFWNIVPYETENHSLYIIYWFLFIKYKKPIWKVYFNPFRFIWKCDKLSGEFLVSVSMLYILRTLPVPVPLKSWTCENIILLTLTFYLNQIVKNISFRLLETAWNGQIWLYTSRKYEYIGFLDGFEILFETKSTMLTR